MNQSVRVSYRSLAVAQYDEHLKEPLVKRLKI